MAETTATFDKYQVARDKIVAGIWTVDAEAGHIYGVRGKRLGYLTTCGYIGLSAEDRPRHKLHLMAHRVIWESVHGPIPSPLVDYQINHLNSVRTDNRLVNLELVTARENVWHLHEQGRAADRRGENGPGAKLTAEKVADIRRRYADGQRQQDIADDYGLARQYVGMLVKGHRWGHTLTGPVPGDGRKPPA